MCKYTCACVRVYVCVCDSLCRFRILTMSVLVVTGLCIDSPTVFFKGGTLFVYITYSVIQSFQTSDWLPVSFLIKVLLLVKMCVCVREIGATAHATYLHLENI